MSTRPTPNELHPTQRALLQMIEARPNGIPAREVAATLGISVPCTLFRLRALRNRGLIGPSALGGHNVLWVPAAHLARAQAEFSARAKKARQERQRARARVKRRQEREKAIANEPARFRHILKAAGEWQVDHAVANNSVFSLRA